MERGRVVSFISRLEPRMGNPRSGCLLRHMNFRPTAALAICWIGLLWNLSREPALAAGEKTNSLSPSELKALSLEELMNQEVVLVTRTPERLSSSPSAVQVVSGMDIRRSGALTLPEALRLAPNLQVAQQNSYTWAITARGFNGAPLANNSLADKLLVMIDGRSIYTPLFGGVFWDVQNVLLEDVDRIEVVSGPGGTLWGANAVNGVINIMTKSARDTQGLYVSGGGGSYLQDFGAIRYGGQAGSNLFYRVFAQRHDFNSTLLRTGADANDAWDMSHGGFRMDYYPSEQDSWMLEGEIYSGSEGNPIIENMDGQSLIGRWTRSFSEDSILSVHAYFDRTWRDLPTPSFSDELTTYDFDFQHQFPLGKRQRVVWGGGYRLAEDKVNNSPQLSFSPAEKSLQLFSGFVQDEISLVPERLTFTLGTKLEHNDYSGFEIQPSARLAWTPSERHTIWGSVSRAVRSPARFDTDELVPVFNTPHHEFKSEKVLAWEAGYRVRPWERLSISMAGFYNEYDDLRSLNQNPEAPPPFAFANDQQGETWGLEISGNLQLMPWWRLRGGYTFLRKDLSLTSDAALPLSARLEAVDPDYQWLLQSMLDLPGNLHLDLVGRYTSGLTYSQRVSSYFTFDARLAWTWRERWEFSIVGKNLWDDAHAEFPSPSGVQEIPRSIFGRVAWRF